LIWFVSFELGHMATTSILTGARQAAKKLPRTVQEVPALYGFSETRESNLFVVCGQMNVLLRILLSIWILQSLPSSIKGVRKGGGV